MPSASTSPKRWRDRRYGSTDERAARRARSLRRGDRERCSDYVRTVLLPNLDAPPSEFYDAGGKLKPKYGWYLFHLQRTVREGQRLTELAAELHAELDGEG
jgi:hypothetical protein